MCMLIKQVLFIISFYRENTIFFPVRVVLENFFLFLHWQIVEQAVKVGRVDAVLQTQNICFVIEMKINATADSALSQIRERKYYQSYELSGKKIILVGIAFDTKLNNVSEIKYEDL
jgi:hypothetical protein